MLRPGLILLLAALAATLPADGRSQDPAGGVPAELAPGLQVTSVASSGTVLAGGDVAVRLTPGTVVGGTGFALLQKVHIERGAGGPTALGFGYGGAFAEYRRPMPGENRGGRSVSARLTAGAAKADLVRAGTNTDLGTENVFLVHPAVGVDLPVLDWAEASVRAGYRWSTALGRLPGVAAGAVRGVTATISVRFIHSPGEHVPD